MLNFNMIVAMDSQQGIGKSGTLPWHLPSDLRHFKALTTETDSVSQKNAVIMGRKTWASIPDKFRPLPHRINVVLTRDKDLHLPPDVLPAASFEDAFTQLDHEQYKEQLHHVFVIGGQQIFEIALRSTHCHKLYITSIQQSFQCDTFFPDFDKTFKRIHKTAPLKENGIRFYFAEYLRKIV